MKRDLDTTELTLKMVLSQLPVNGGLDQMKDDLDVDVPEKQIDSALVLFLSKTTYITPSYRIIEVTPNIEIPLMKHNGHKTKAYLSICYPRELFTFL